MSETFTATETGKQVITKDPDAILDYSIKWTDWLISPDTIITATAVSDDLALTIVSVVHDGYIVTMWVSGGTPGGRSSLRCRITTQAGRTDDRTVYLKIKER